jgi:hypothetical protein
VGSQLFCLQIVYRFCTFTLLSFSSISLSNTVIFDSTEGKKKKEEEEEILIAVRRKKKVQLEEEYAQDISI